MNRHLSAASSRHLGQMLLLAVTVLFATGDLQSQDRAGVGGAARATPRRADQAKKRSAEERRNLLRREIAKLSKEDQRKLRESLRKVWRDKEVVRTRDAYRKAGKTYQDALHSALMEEDPALRPFLENLVETGLDLPLAKENDPVTRVARLFDLPLRLVESRQRALRKAFQKVNQAPRIKAIRKEIAAAPAGKKRALNEKLREALRAGMLKEFPALEDWIKNKDKAAD
jgi:hypothetical protein